MAKRMGAKTIEVKASHLSDFTARGNHAAHPRSRGTAGLTKPVHARSGKGLMKRDARHRLATACAAARRRIFPPGHFLTANTQTTPPCGTLFSKPRTLAVANASWMRCASTPQPGLDGDILRAVHLIGDRHAHDAGVGLLLPKQFAGLGMEGAEHPVIGAADKDEDRPRWRSPNRTVATSGNYATRPSCPWPDPTPAVRQSG